MSATLDSVEAWSGKDRGDENFPVGSLLIRRDLRRHVHAYYAFARNADDISDSPALPAPAGIRCPAAVRLASVLLSSHCVRNLRNGQPALCCRRPCA